MRTLMIVGLLLVLVVPAYALGWEDAIPDQGAATVIMPQLRTAAVGVSLDWKIGEFKDVEFHLNAMEAKGCYAVGVGADLGWVGRLAGLDNWPVDMTPLQELLDKLRLGVCGLHEAGANQFIQPGAYLHYPIVEAQF